MISYSMMRNSFCYFCHLASFKSYYQLFLVYVLSSHRQPFCFDYSQYQAVSSIRVQASSWPSSCDVAHTSLHSIASPSPRTIPLRLSPYCSGLQSPPLHSSWRGTFHCCLKGLTRAAWQLRLPSCVRPSSRNAWICSCLDLLRRRRREELTARERGCYWVEELTTCLESHSIWWSSAIAIEISGRSVIKVFNQSC